MKGMSEKQRWTYFRTSSTARLMDALRLALEAHKMKHRAYPKAKSLSELETALFPEFTSGVAKKDAWGHELRYIASADGRSYRLVSAGGDGMFEENSWTKRGSLTSADDDAVIENGVFVRNWTDDTQPGEGPRRRFDSRARALLSRADTLSEAGDSSRALTAYIDAVKIDPAAADLDAISRYSGHSGSQQHLAALRQYLALRPGDWEATGQLVALAGPEEGEALLAQAVKERPGDPRVYALRGTLNARAGRYAAVLEDWKKASELDPSNPERHYVLGVATYETVTKTEGLSGSERRALIRSALAALDRAEALRPDYFESLAYRNLLLRQQAALEDDPAKSKALIAAADAVRARSMEIMKKRRPQPVPEPQPQPAGQEPYPVGDAVKAPVVIERVKPEYPETAAKARIKGIVIAELIVDKNGAVRDARILKPLPFGLDEAALAAVKQWKFRPGTLNGLPVDVIFNVTIGFPPSTE
jgi:TonB family protein